MKIMGLLNIILIAAVLFGFAQRLGFFSAINDYQIIINFAVIVVCGISALLFLRRKKNN